MKQSPASRNSVTVRMFVQRFSATPRGARLARHLAAHQLDVWGVPYGSRTSDTAESLVAELAADAITHGRVAGRDFELALTLETEPDTGPDAGSAPYAGTLRIDVSDPRGERRPRSPRTGATAPQGGTLPDGGRGLLLVEALSDRWCVVERGPVGKTVRAELDLPR